MPENDKKVFGAPRAAIIFDLVDRVEHRAALRATENSRGAAPSGEHEAQWFEEIRTRREAQSQLQPNEESSS